MEHLGGAVGDHKVCGVNGVDEGTREVDGTSTRVGHLLLSSVSVCVGGWSVRVCMCGGWSVCGGEGGWSTSGSVSMCACTSSFPLPGV